MEMEFKNQNKFSGRDNLFFDAALLVIEQQEATVDLLKEKFNVNDARAEKILKELETEGIVSELLDNNTRDTLMSEEELLLIYNYKKPIKPVVESDVNETKAKKQNKKAESEQQKNGIPFWLKILLLILIFILIFFITRRVIMFSSTRTSEEVSVEKSGWVQEGDNWNYYDIDGKKLTKSIIDEGGKYYYFDDNGNLAIDRWVDYEGKTFYVNEYGVMLKNQWVGDYYVGNDGNVLKNTITPDGYKVGSDGRYIVETKPAQPQTIIVRETVPVTLPPTEVATTIANVENNVGATNIVTGEYGTDITAPTAGTSAVIGNASIDSEKANNYTIKNSNNYMDKSYLENGKMCSINILIPVLVDKDGNECEGFKSGMMQEQDSIVTELFDIAESSIEEIDDDYRTTYKYISSISFTDPRIRTQDEYSLVIRESGKCNWNNGKSSKITLTIDFDKNNNSVSYFIEE